VTGIDVDARRVLVATEGMQIRGFRDGRAGARRNLPGVRCETLEMQ
jgi:hypothetical protein